MAGLVKMIHDGLTISATSQDVDRFKLAGFEVVDEKSAEIEEVEETVDEKSAEEPKTSKAGGKSQK